MDDRVRPGDQLAEQVLVDDREPIEPVAARLGRVGRSDCVVGDAEADYDVSAEWFQADKRAVAWDNPDLSVPWSVSEAYQANPSPRAFPRPSAVRTGLVAPPRPPDCPKRPARQLVADR